MAFEYFSSQKVDIAVLEVGMGGRLDSTNVVTPELAVITSIGMDHQQFLGDTIEKIASEKAGIIKPNIPVVIGKNSTSVWNTIKEIASEKNAELIFATENSNQVVSDLKGTYQKDNLQTAITAIRVMREKGWRLDDKCVEIGLKSVKSLTGFQGRWQVIGEEPRIIVDVGHNVDGVKSVMENLHSEPYKHLHIVWGMVADKDARSILELLPKEASYYWCKPNVPRGKDATELRQLASSFNLKGDSYPSVIEALSAAKSNAELGDLIFVGGSVFVVGEVL
jgi:dihydrofolate synthase/folylpolyglutamate synthase